MFSENDSILEDFEITIGDSSEVQFFSLGHNEVLDNNWLCTMSLMNEEKDQIILQREVPKTADSKYFKFMLTPLETSQLYVQEYFLTIEIKNTTLNYNKEIVHCYIKCNPNYLFVVPPAPVFTSITSPGTLTISVPENQVACCTLQASDTIKYTIQGGDSAEFICDESTGEVKFLIAPNYEIRNFYSFVAKASGYGGDTLITVLVNITDVIIEPSAPVFITPLTVSVPENQYNAIILHASDTFSYDISTGDYLEFNINHITGEVKFNTKPDYETKNVYTFLASASGPGGITNQLITINITDVNENPAPYFVMDNYRNIEESGYECINLQALNATNYSISGTDSIYLNVNPNDGTVMFKQATNAAIKSDYYFTGTASGLGGSVSIDIHIHIYDIIQVKDNGMSPR